MKNVGIIKIDDKFAVVSTDVESIKKGDKVFNIRTNKFCKAEALDGMVGYTSFGGHAFLWFRKGIHCKFIKYITKKDIRILIEP